MALKTLADFRFLLTTSDQRVFFMAGVFLADLSAARGAFLALLGVLAAGVAIFDFLASEGPAAPVAAPPRLAFLLAPLGVFAAEAP